MDFSNFNLLETNRSESLEISDNELEDELEAILTGKSVAVKTKQTTISSNTKRIKQNETKITKTQTQNKKLDKTKESDQMISDELLNIDKLGIIEDFDDNDEDVDENDEDLLSEINAIASKSATRVPKSNEMQTSRVESEDNQSFNKILPTKVSDIGHKNENKSQKFFEQKSSEELISFVTNIPKYNQNVSISSNRIESNKEIPKSSQLTNDKTEIPRLNNLKDQYKRAAQMANTSGQKTDALFYLKTAKKIEIIVKALEEGQTVDLSEMPPPPTFQATNHSNKSVQLIEENKSSLQTNNNQNLVEMDVENIELTTEDAQKFFNAPPPPNTVMEALEQRLTKFKSTQEIANQENNSSKARRLGRIIKQYENAIKDVKKGKTLDFDELPTPPGFGPIPVPNQSNTSKTENTIQVKSDPIKSPPKPKVESIGFGKTPDPPKVAQTSPTVVKTANTVTPPKAERPQLKRASSSANKQLNYLLERQTLFKEAALESKKKGDIQQAKEYLRLSKGFDPLIEATRNGLPIDATSIPTPPQLNDDFVMVSKPQFSESQDLEIEEMFRKIQIEVQNQIEMCKRNKEYFLQLGDISTSSKFEKYAVDSRKDLDLLEIRWKNGQKLPNIKYETRTFSVVICNTEVTTNEVSVEVVKALDIPGKPDIDTYVRLEFPFPNDNHQTARTKTVKNSVNPVFNQTFKFDIDRKSRQLPRIFKRHPLKLEVMSKGGDSLIGTALIKLNDFENKCTIHECYELVEGRKAVGGRIEAKVRIREPLLSKQVEEVKEKWISFV